MTINLCSRVKKFYFQLALILSFGQATSLLTCGCPECFPASPIKGATVHVYVDRAIHRITLKKIT